MTGNSFSLHGSWSVFLKEVFLLGSVLDFVHFLDEDAEFYLDGN
jgi:hypothetical protein